MAESAGESKSEEREIVDILKEIAGRLALPATFIDVGGNKNADVSSPFAEMGWQVLIIEPQVFCYDLLVKKFDGVRNVQVMNAACSDNAGVATLFHGNDGVGSETASFNSESDEWTRLAVSSTESEQVNVVTLEDVISDSVSMREIGILKVDTESWDYQVIKGLNLSRHQPYLIITEEYLWKVDQAVAKHVMLEEAGYVNLGFVGYNTIWAHGKTGARWSYGALGEWLTAIEYEYPLRSVRARTHGIGALTSRTRVQEGVSYVGQSIALFVDTDELPANGSRELQVSIVIANFSDRSLPSLPLVDGTLGIFVSYHCENPVTGESIVWDGIRTELTGDLPPGGACIVSANVLMPAESDQIRLVFDLVQEGVGWFSGVQENKHPRTEVLIVQTAQTPHATVKAGGGLWPRRKKSGNAK